MKESADLLFRVSVFLSQPSGLSTVQQEFVNVIIREIGENKLEFGLFELLGTFIIGI
ncbi:hypothetical protein [Clostridium sp. CTA-1]